MATKYTSSEVVSFFSGELAIPMYPSSSDSDTELPFAGTIDSLLSDSINSMVSDSDVQTDDDNETVSGLMESEGPKRLRLDDYSTDNESDVPSEETESSSTEDESSDNSSSDDSSDVDLGTTTLTNRIGRGRAGTRGRGTPRDRGRGGRRNKVHLNSLPKNVKDIIERDTKFVAVGGEDKFCPLREPGPHLPPNTEIDPLALFELYFHAKVVDRVLESTLAYAEKKKNELTISYCKFLRNPFSKAELLSYIGALILLGLHGVHNHRYAWSTKKAQILVRLSELLTCERYEVIGTFLHLVTPEEESALSGNRLCKILPLHNYIKSKCSDLML